MCSLTQRLYKGRQDVQNISSQINSKMKIIKIIKIIKIMKIMKMSKVEKKEKARKAVKQRAPLSTLQEISFKQNAMQI